jgi:uncharacterized protein (TIGR02271 family)
MAQAITKTIAAVFDSQATAERAVQDLLNAGFQRSEVQLTSNDAFSSNAALGNTGLSGTHPATHSAGGGIGGFFRNLFGTDIQDDETRTYSDAMSRGSALVTVQTDEARIERAQDVLERYNPVDIDTLNATTRDSIQGVATEREQAIPVVEEELKVGKRSVQRGGVRVYTRVIEQPVEEQLSLREEHVRVERRPVDRPATEADLRPPERVIEMTETVEEPVVSKEARVREEVVIGKEADTRTETIRDTVRKTDVNVERVSPGTREYDEDFERDFRTQYSSTPGARYETYAPAYQYGYTTASDARYRGKNWSDVEDTLRTDYLRNNPNSKWDQVKGAVRYGWEKVTNKR